MHPVWIRVVLPDAQAICSGDVTSLSKVIASPSGVGDDGVGGDEGEEGRKTGSDREMLLGQDHDVGGAGRSDCALSLLFSPEAVGREVPETQRQPADDGWEW